MSCQDILDLSGFAWGHNYLWPYLIGGLDLFIKIIIIVCQYRAKQAFFPKHNLIVSLVINVLTNNCVE